MGYRIVYDRTWVTEEGAQGDWMWYSEGDGYNIFNDSEFTGRIPPEVSKWCHDTWNNPHLMRYYPGAADANATDMIWIKQKKDLLTFLLRWA